MLCGGVTVYSPLKYHGAGTTAKKVGIVGYEQHKRKSNKYWRKLRKKEKENPNKIKSTGHERRRNKPLPFFFIFVYLFVCLFDCLRNFSELGDWATLA